MKAIFCSVFNKLKKLTNPPGTDTQHLPIYVSRQWTASIVGIITNCDCAPWQSRGFCEGTKGSHGQDGAQALGASAFKDTAMGIGECSHPGLITGSRLPDTVSPGIKRDNQTQAGRATARLWQCYWEQSDFLYPYQKENMMAIARINMVAVARIQWCLQAI